MIVSPSKQESVTAAVRGRLEEGSGRCELLALHTEEGDCEPRDVGGLERPEKVREQILPRSLQKGTSPADTLILAQEELY